MSGYQPWVRISAPWPFTQTPLPPNPAIHPPFSLSALPTHPPALSLSSLPTYPPTLSLFSFPCISHHPLLQPRSLSNPFLPSSLPPPPCSLSQLSLSPSPSLRLPPSPPRSLCSLSPLSLGLHALGPPWICSAEPADRVRTHGNPPQAKDHHRRVMCIEADLSRDVARQLVRQPGALILSP